MKFLGLGKQRLLRTKRRHRGVDERTLNFGYLFEVISLAVFEDMLVSMVPPNQSNLHFLPLTSNKSQVSQPDLV